MLNKQHFAHDLKMFNSNQNRPLIRYIYCNLMLLKVQVIVATGHGDVLVANAETDVQYLLRSDYVSGN